MANKFNTKNTKETDAFLLIGDFATRHFAWIAFGVYASGFLIWNIYLSYYGFFEYNFTQTRFLSAGLLIWFPVFIVFIIAHLFLEKIPLKNKITRKSIGYIGGCIIGVWFPLLFFVLFPQLPQALGGAKPIPMSIIGTPEQIAFLGNFDVHPAANAEGKGSVQTYTVCLIYQNDQYVLFFNTNNFATSSDQNGVPHVTFSPRVISLSREQFLGFQQMLGTYSDFICGLSGSMYNGIVKIPTSNK